MHGAGVRMLQALDHPARVRLRILVRFRDGIDRPSGDVLQRLLNDLEAFPHLGHANVIAGEAIPRLGATDLEIEVAVREVWLVFGCGGDRDRGKRPLMGEAAARASDLVVLTSDNPRTEDPQAILKDVRAGIEPKALREYSREELAQGFSDKGFTVIESRREAVRCAILAARPGDIVLLAGKGHENYQIIGTDKRHFDDAEEAARVLQSRAAFF